jgi:hypothetical protein
MDAMGFLFLTQEQQEAQEVKAQLLYGKFKG